MELAATTEFQESNAENASPEAQQSSPDPIGEPIQTVEPLSSTLPYLEEIEKEQTKDVTNSIESSTPPLTPTTSPFTPTTSPFKHLHGAPHRDSSWLEIDVCREFLRGECTRSAEECKYAHPTGPVILKEGNKVTCCFDFLKDRCTREKCKYLHPSNSVKERLVMAGKQYGQNMVVAKPLITSPSMQPLQVGGAYPIPYSYINSPLSSNSVPPHNTLASYSTMSPYYSSPTKMEVCDAFEQGYSCDKRDLCLFAHPEPHIRINADRTVTVCWNYLNGFCNRPNCWFYHPTPFQLMTYQFPNRFAMSQQSALDSTVYLTPYSPTPESNKVTSPLQQPQLSPPAILTPYPFMYPAQVVQMPSSFSPSASSTQFSKTSLPQPQTIVS